MTKREHLAAIGSLPVLCRHDDFGNVESVTIYRHAPLEDIERDAFFLQVTTIGAKERRKLGAGGVPADTDSLRIAALFGDVPVHPTQRFGDVPDEPVPFHVVH